MTSPIGVVYVLRHPEYRSVKVGVTTYRSKRLHHLWKTFGWVPYKQLRLASKGLAETVEQSTLLHLRHRYKHPVHLSLALTEGWTETVSERHMTAEELWDLVCLEAGYMQLAPTVGAFKPINHKPPRNRRRKGDTPKYVPAAGREASRTARAAQVGKTVQPPKRRTAQRAAAREAKNRRED